MEPLAILWTTCQLTSECFVARVGSLMRDEFEWDVRKRPEFPGAIRAEQAGNGRSFSHVSSETAKPLQ